MKHENDFVVSRIKKVLKYQARLVLKKKMITMGYQLDFRFFV